MAYGKPKKPVVVSTEAPAECEGFTFTGPRTYVYGNAENPICFVQRWAFKPSTWLRVLRKTDRSGWWVAGHKSRKEVIEDGIGRAEKSTHTPWP